MSGHLPFTARHDDKARCPQSPERTKTLIRALTAATGKHPGRTGLQRQSNGRPERAKGNRRRRAAHTPSLIHRQRPVRAHQDLMAGGTERCEIQAGRGEEAVEKAGRHGISVSRDFTSVVSWLRLRWEAAASGCGALGGGAV